MGTFSQFEHTADIGLEVRAASWPDLLETAARALVDVMLEDLPANVDTWQEVAVDPPDDLRDDREELFLEWLQELLYRFETQRLVPLAFDVQDVCVSRVCARVGFGRFDPDRHRTRLEVKAVTYHELAVRQEGGGWVARFIVDV
jgi:SHS2 domain-containing protein